VLAAVIFTACGPKLIQVPMSKPTPTGTAFADGSGPKATMRIVDARGAEAAKFHVTMAGLASLPAVTEGLEPMAFLADNLKAEFAARGYPVTVTTDAAAPADMVLKVERYRIVHSRVNGWTPWEVMHQFRGTLSSGNREFPILAYFYNGKVPVWGLGEVWEPCVDLPESIITKEIASKVNRSLLKFKASDAAVDAIVKRAEPKASKDNGPYMELVELAGTNNPKAMDVLKKYAASHDDFVRSVAFDAMGILGAEKEQAYLKSQYGSLKGPMDKTFALKAIGDAGDKASLDFVADQVKDPLFRDEVVFSFLVDLYRGR
jgi:hypothetical protein